MMFAYLAGLLIGIGGLAVIDWRYKLAFWHDARRTALVMIIGVMIFLVWDALGIGLGIFLHGSSPYSLPFNVAPELPVEEFFFLLLLCYNALILYRGVQTWRSRTS